MVEELLRIENGVVMKDGRELIKRLNLQTFKGEILGIISDNIREKECILEVLNGNAGLHYGWVSFDEKRIPEDEASQILKSKIAVIENKSKLVDNLTVAENIFVVRGGFKKYFVYKRLLYRQAAGLLSEFKLNIRPEAYVGSLTPLERCMVELIKAYATGRRLIVCSDFTSFLSSAEVKKVIQSILWLKKKGVGFIMVENYDDILFQFSDRLAVIHNGKTIHYFDRVDMDKKTVYALLMEEKEKENEAQGTNETDSSVFSSPPVFEFSTSADDLLPALTFQIHKGEIINILYQEEESCSELLGLFKGEIKQKSCRMILESKKYSPKGMWDAIRKGVVFIEEDPIDKMLFYDMSVLDNLCFTMSNKVKGLWFLRKYRKSIIRHLGPVFGEAMLQMQMSKLEPVMLQRLAYSKWLLYVPKVVVCKRPFSAADVHMRQVTEQLINTYVMKGIAVLILTSNVSEAHTMGKKTIHLNSNK